MKMFMTTAAAAALITASPAFAAGAHWQLAQAETPVEQTQDLQATTGCPEGTTETAEGEACPPDTAAVPTDETSTETDAAASEVQPEEDLTTGSLPDEETATTQTGGMEEDSTQMAAADGSMFIAEQDENTVLSSELVGTSVYNPADEVLGDVNDVVWTKDGTVEGVIIGVGGFLGIGEKAVAVAYDAIEISTDENGNEKLILSATEEELAAAPEFLTADEKLALIQQEQIAPVDDGATGLVPPTAPEPAPAQ